MRRALRLLWTERGRDFSAYKTSTLERQFSRRAHIAGYESLDRYVDALERDETEMDELADLLLVGFTGFFRGVDFFERLAEQWLPHLLGRFDQPLRIWVPGCSTGEEAYSIAMLFASSCREGPPGFQIFATDLRGGALERARAGVYEESDVAAVPESLREQYLEQTTDGFRIVEPLRHSLLFSEHDLLQEDPLGEIHLISCRNLLIYLRAEGQRLAIERFRAALHPGGLLALGPSEFLRWPQGFRVLDRDLRLFERNGADSVATGEAPARENARQPEQATRQSQLLEALYDRYLPRGFLLDLEGNVVRACGGADELLRLKHRRPSTALLDLLPAEIETSVAKAISRATWDTERVSFPQVELTAGGRRRRFDIALEPLVTAEGDHGFFLSFAPSAAGGTDPRTSPDPQSSAAGAPGRLRLSLRETRANEARLEQQLRETRDELANEHERRRRLDMEIDILRRAQTEGGRPSASRRPDRASRDNGTGTNTKGDRDDTR